MKPAAARFRAPSPGRRVFVVGLVLTVGLCQLCVAQGVDSTQMAGLRWRNIGPFRGGRVSAVTGVPGQSGVFYMGLPQGGVWKTTSAGSTWFPVFDSVKDVSDIGSLQVAPSDPNVVYAGIGEAFRTVDDGSGIYRSGDAGKTWERVGLEQTAHVTALLVDPHDANLVLAAGLGKSQIADDQRGVFRSTDGGKSWTKTLYVDDKTGVQHLAWAFDNPSVVFAMSRRFFNQPRGTAQDPNAPSGTALYKSLDEGLTWTPLDGKGLPKLVGKTCVAVAPGTNSQRVFMIGTFGLYRSDDGGANWHQMAADDRRIANGQGNYTSGVYVDPKNPDIVYTLATCVYRSLDGGKTFEAFKGAPGGDDPQQLWIDPTNGDRMLLGGDQGGVVSEDAGNTWSSWYNQSTGQFYSVTTDNRFPYWVYGVQQDSGGITTSSRGDLGQINVTDWKPYPGSENGNIVIDPLNPNVSYAQGEISSLVRIVNPPGLSNPISPDMNPGSGLRGFSLPMAFAPWNAHELIVGYQRLVSTTDEGIHWRDMSPNLTLRPSELAAHKKAADGEGIASFACSPVAAGTVWVGTSNGLIQLTKDGGKTWSDASVPNPPGKDKAMIYKIDASPLDAKTAYAVDAGFRFNDDKPYVFRTHDSGRTWTEIDRGLPLSSPGGAQALAILADRVRSGLLFALVNSGVYVSFDDGDDWQSLSLNLPCTSYTDLRIHGDDLVLSSFGRGLWILDDYSPLRELSARTTSEAVHLFKPADAVRVRRNLNGDTPFPVEMPHAPNPPLGAIIDYSLSATPNSEVTLDILDSSGHLVRHMSSLPVTPYEHLPYWAPTFWFEVRKPLPVNAGLNRINWNLRYDTPPAFNHDPNYIPGAVVGDTPEAIEGPLALPGIYTARLTVGGQAVTQTFKVVRDPRSTSNDRDLVERHRLEMDICAGVQEAWDGGNEVSATRAELAKLIASNPPADVLQAAKALDGKLAAIHGTVSPILRVYGPPPPDSFVSMNEILLEGLEALSFDDTRPPEPVLYGWGSEWAELKSIADKWHEANRKDLVDLNALLAKNGLPPIPANDLILRDSPMPEKRYLPVVGK